MSEIKKLAQEIMQLLDKHEVGYQTAIYVDGTKYSQFQTEGHWDIAQGVRGSQYTEYANDETITMTFEGYFYEIMNYGRMSYVLEEFNELVESFGYSYELGEAWNLALYAIHKL